MILVFELEPRRRRRVAGAGQWLTGDRAVQAVGVATQVAGASYVDVGEADIYAWEREAYARKCGACAGNADSQARVGCELWLAL